MNQHFKFRSRFIEDLKWYYFSLEDIAKLGDAFPNYSDWSQFSGILDKNGSEIYTSDIVSWSPYIIGSDSDTEDNRQVCEVELSSGGWRVSYDNHKPALGAYSNIEVIGNITQNPELLSK